LYEGWRSVAHLLWIEFVTSSSGEQETTTKAAANKTAKRRMNVRARARLIDGRPRAARGDTVAPPGNVMNSRRRI
jgi:hypothetical protein